MRRIGVVERRARLAVRQRLAGVSRAAGAVEAARAVVALHATDPASVFLSVRARTGPPAAVGEIERALYEDRALVRMLGMRRTMFVVPDELAPVVQAACTRAIAQAQRTRYAGLLEQAGVGDGAWLKELEEEAARALAARGEVTGAELSRQVPTLRTQITLAEGKSYQRSQGVTTWVLFMLAAEGRIVRGRPVGSWISSQWRWAPIEGWLPGGMPELDAGQARAELVRRWLAAFGPGTVADIRWWTGWTAGLVTQALAAIGPVEVELDGGTGLVLPGDEEPPGEPGEPWVALLPALDPTPMGWQQRGWYLGEHAPALFDRSGNIGPTVWADGRIVGGWAQRAGGEVAFRLLEDVGAETAAEVAAQAAELADWIGDVRVTPRFRTPLERELTA